MKNAEIKKEKTELNELVNRITIDIKKMREKPVKEDDLKHANIEIVEMDVAEIIHQDKISISSQDGILKIPVYLDENYDWYFKRESIKPFIAPLPDAVLLKVLTNKSIPSHKKLIACYPLELFITEVVDRANQLMQSDIQFLSNETENKEVQS